MLGKDFEDLDLLIAEIDMNGDGEIDFSEFKILLNKLVQKQKFIN